MMMQSREAKRIPAQNQVPDGNLEVLGARIRSNYQSTQSALSHQIQPIIKTN